MRIECRQFTGAQPCAPHKRDGRSCEACDAFEPVSTRILIVKLAAAGDVLRTTCVLPALRAQYRDAQITWITARASMPLLDGNPYIDRAIARDDALPRVSIERYDVVFGLDADESGAAIATLARAGERAGFRLDERGRVVPANPAADEWWVMGLDDHAKRANRRTYPRLLYDLCGLAGPVAAPQFVVPDHLAAEIRARFRPSLAAADYTLVLNTGGGMRWAQKKWTSAHYADFIRLVRREHPGWAVIVTGGPEERAMNAALLVSIDDEAVIDGGCGHSVQAFGALLALGDALVTSDSLALHMATALGVPVIAIVGPTSPWELDLYGRGEVVHADVPCIACYHRRCPLPVTCMDLLAPDAVLDAVERVRLQAAEFAPLTCGPRVLTRSDLRGRR